MKFAIVTEIYFNKIKRGFYIQTLCCNLKYKNSKKKNSISNLNVVWVKGNARLRLMVFERETV